MTHAVLAALAFVQSVDATTLGGTPLPPVDTLNFGFLTGEGPLPAPGQFYAVLDGAYTKLYEQSLKRHQEMFGRLKARNQPGDAASIVFYQQLIADDERQLREIQDDSDARGKETPREQQQRMLAKIVEARRQLKEFGLPDNPELRSRFEEARKRLKITEKELREEIDSEAGKQRRK